MGGLPCRIRLKLVPVLDLAQERDDVTLSEVADRCRDTMQTELDALSGRAGGKAEAEAEADAKAKAKAKSQ
jgi:hypothetical protein